MVLGLLIGVIATSICAFRWQREIYQEIIDLIERQRDEARTEAKTFRGLLFPILNKPPETSAAPVSGEQGRAAGRGTLPAPVPQNPAQALQSMLLTHRVPFRQKFNLARKLSNSKQQKTDALASALEKQPSGEKNVTA